MISCANNLALCPWSKTSEVVQSQLFYRLVFARRLQRFVMCPFKVIRKRPFLISWSNFFVFILHYLIFYITSYIFCFFTGKIKMASIRHTKIGHFTQHQVIVCLQTRLKWTIITQLIYNAYIRHIVMYVVLCCGDCLSNRFVVHPVYVSPPTSSQRDIY